MNAILVNQSRFILTADMVPIWSSGFGREGGCIFICPLPKGYKKVVENELAEIKNISQVIKTTINRHAQLSLPPFENILLGYHERSEKEQKDLFKNFQITEVNIDERGVYAVQAGNDCNGGDIYLNSNISTNYDVRVLESLSFLFEPKTAFYCHNVDFYWQALLTREFCIRYFNWLNRKMAED